MTQTNEIFESRDFRVDDTFIKAGKKYILAYCAGALVSLHTLSVRLEELNASGDIGDSEASKLLLTMSELSDQIYKEGMLK